MLNHKIYKNRGVRVSPRIKEDIKGLANAFRDVYAQITLHQRLDLLKLIEVILPRMTNLKFEFILIEKEEMGEVEAAMSPDSEPPRIYRRVFYLSQAAMPDRVKLS